MDDPFYSEENWKALIKAKEQLDRGEGILFDIENLSTYNKAVLKKELCEEFENEEWSKPYTDLDELFKDLGLDETD